ncbi:hypothetical protein AB1N83_014333 [Pleurotus pulmonarius]
MFLNQQAPRIPFRHLRFQCRSLEMNAVAASWLSADLIQHQQHAPLPYVSHSIVSPPSVPRCAMTTPSEWDHIARALRPRYSHLRMVQRPSKRSVGKRDGERQVLSSGSRAARPLALAAGAGALKLKPKPQRGTNCVYAVIHAPEPESAPAASLFAMRICIPARHTICQRKEGRHFLCVLNRQDPATAGPLARRPSRGFPASCAGCARATYMRVYKARIGNGGQRQPTFDYRAMCSSRLQVRRRRDVERLTCSRRRRTDR